MPITRFGEWLNLADRLRAPAWSFGGVTPSARQLAELLRQ